MWGQSAHQIAGISPKAKGVEGKISCKKSGGRKAGCSSYLRIEKIDENPPEHEVEYIVGVKNLQDRCPTRVSPDGESMNVADPDFNGKKTKASKKEGKKQSWVVQ